MRYLPAVKLETKSTKYLILSRMLFWEKMVTMCQDVLQQFQMCLDVEKQFSAAIVT
jgi:hypothetical protein